MPLTALEQKLLNFVNVAIDAAAHLVAQKNPAYDNLITLTSAAVDQVNASVNPSAPAAATAIAAAATAISASVAPVQGAVGTVASAAASATQKASAAGIIVQDVEAVFASIKALF